MNTEPTRVLVIEDDVRVRRVLRLLLEGEGYLVLEAGNASEGVGLARRLLPEVILLDLGLPDQDGTDVAAELGPTRRHAIIVVSARDKEQQKIRALDLGATDYVTKPFSPAELLARIRVGLRHLRGHLAEPQVFEYRELRIDFATERVSLAGREIALSPTEYKLLRTLVRHRGTLVTHRVLLSTVWGNSALDDLHSLRVYIRRLRSKLEGTALRPTYILTEPTLGYRFGAGHEHLA
jgi:two-component system KDP operon response regulator KdpE